MRRDKNLIELNYVNKRFSSTENIIVSNLNLKILSGQILALLGPNGAGKTTAVKMIAGLIFPTSGTIHILGTDVTQNRAQAVRHIGAVLEGARNLYWRLSAEENLRYFGTLRLVPRRQLQQRINDLLTLLGLEPHRHKEVRHFSRGMQQKLAIAAALLHDPAVLLLDEPTLGLDLPAARQLEEMIALLARERGKGILLTTHQMPLAERLADRITVIHQGRVVAAAETQALLREYGARRDVTEIHFAAPPPAGVLARVRLAHPTAVLLTTSGDPHLQLPALPQPQLIALLAQLDAAGAAIREVARRRARLEEVFLDLTTPAGADGRGRNKTHRGAAAKAAGTAGEE